MDDDRLMDHRKHDRAASCSELAQEHSIPKKKRTLSLRRPLLSSSRPHSTSSTLTTPISEPAPDIAHSNHVISSPLADSLSSAPVSSQVSPLLRQEIPQQDTQEEAQWTSHRYIQTRPDGLSTNQAALPTLDTKGEKEPCLQEGCRLEIKTSIVSSSTEATCRGVDPAEPTLVEHTEEIMQEATKGATVIDGLPAGSTALETTLAQFSASNESDDDQVNKDNDYEDDDYPEDEIRDDIDQETYQAPTNDPVAENACPVCGIDLSALDTMTPDAHVNRCLDGTIDNSSAVHGHGTEERAIHGKSSTPTTNEPTPSTSNKFTSPRFKITNGSSSAKPSTRTQSKQKVARPCPFYKKMPDTNFTVDAFSYGAIDGCDAYFLTHFHSDHYGGLTSTWSHGPIYCSNITANLVISRLGVDTNYVKRLPMDEPTIVQGVTIRLLDANHCPGSVLFVFDLQNPQRRYLHTGDFRAIPDMCLNPILCQPPNTPIDILYLDTTYMNPKYTFPPQDTVVREATHLVCKEMGIQPLEVATPIAAAVVVAPAPVVQVAIKKVNVMMSWLRRESGNTEKLQSMSIKASQSVKMRQTWQEPSEKNKIVICVGTYLIGKERVFKAIAKAIKSKVFVQDSKLQILSCLEDPELMDMLTSDRLEAQVHLLHMGSDMSPQALQEYLDSLGSAFTRLIAIRPTGWTFTGSKKFTPADDGLMNGQTEMATALSPTPTTLELRPSFMSSTIKIYPIPYSEHSSFNELAGFVRSLDIRKVIPTVGVGSEKGRHAMNEWFRRWEEERRQGKGWE